MEIITKIITGLGGVGTVTGLFWIWAGAVDFMTNGVYLAIAFAGIAAGIVAALSQIKF